MEDLMEINEPPVPLCVRYRSLSVGVRERLGFR